MSWWPRLTPTRGSMEDPKVAEAGGGVAGYSTCDGRQLWRLPEVPTCSPVLLDGVLHLPQAYDLVTGQPIEFPTRSRIECNLSCLDSRAPVPISVERRIY